MDKIYIRRCVNGKSFAASATPDFAALEGRTCPFSGEEFEAEIKEVNPDNAEVMGLNYNEALAGLKKEGIYFGRFKVNLGETMIL
ncbi:MAG: hypothetical protein AB1896_13700 [Thermodesulfobacteriota bacterium]